MCSNNIFEGIFLLLQVIKCEIVLVMKVSVLFLLICIYKCGMGNEKIIIYCIPTLIIPTDVAISTWIVIYYTNEMNVPLVYHSNLLADKKKILYWNVPNLYHSLLRSSISIQIHDFVLWNKTLNCCKCHYYVCYF